LAGVDMAGDDLAGDDLAGDNLAVDIEMFVPFVCLLGMVYLVKSSPHRVYGT
jgi:hypothetical protein